MATLPSMDELASAESAGLQQRVVQLEQRVATQEDELTCLRATVADLLRRLGTLEQQTGGSGGGAPGGRTPTGQNGWQGGAVPHYALPTKAMSKSTSNIRQRVSAASGESTPSGTPVRMRNGVGGDGRRRPASPSPRRSTIRTGRPVSMGGSSRIYDTSSSPSATRSGTAAPLHLRTTPVYDDTPGGYYETGVSDSSPGGSSTAAGAQDSSTGTTPSDSETHQGAPQVNGGQGRSTRYQKHAESRNLAPNGAVNGTPGVVGAAGLSPSSGSAGNIRKWRSSADVIDGGKAVGVGGNAGSSPGGVSMRIGKSGSQSNLSGSHRSMSNIGSGVYREPTYNSDDGYLRMYLRNKPVNIHVPSHLREDYNPYFPISPPKQKLKLEWIYGYRGKDCRSNIAYLPTGEILYFTATVIILYNVQEQMQRHYTGHTDDVKCIDVHPNRLFIASGQVAKHGAVVKSKSRASMFDLESLVEEESDSLPHVRIWDSISLQTSCVLGAGEFERAVSCVAFSKADGGSLLAVIDESYDHTLSVWDWQRKVRIADTKSANEQVFAVDWHPTSRHLLVTCGKSQLNFWTLDGSNLVRKVGLFEGRDKPKYVLAIAFTESGWLLSGDSNGSITMWNAGTGRSVKQISKYHDGGVFTLCPLKGGRLISGGGRDRRIVEYAEDLVPTGREYQLPEKAGPVRHVAPGQSGMLLIGTTANSILEGSLALQNFTFVVQGHVDELWGLTRHPTQSQFLTCGYDRVVRLWDCLSKSMVWTREMTDPCQCVAFHPSGHYLAVGSSVGKWTVLDALTRETVLVQHEGSHIMSCVEYSPDGRLVAVGSHDGSIYVYQVSEDVRKYARLGKCAAHGSMITHLDWSTNSEYIRANTGDLEIFYWSAKTCKPLASPDLVRDLEFATDRCTLSFRVCGVWPEISDGTDVNACDRSVDGRIVATGDDYGLVKLFEYPCSEPRSMCNVYGGHSSHVTNVRWLANDSRLISIGGKDSAVFQWAVS